MKYSKALTKLILNPTCAGHLTQSEGMRLVMGQERGLKIYFLIDESDGVIADAKFQIFGPPALVGAAEIACKLALRKNYAQVSRFTADLLDKDLHFPKDAYTYLNLVLSAIDQAMSACQDMPLPASYVEPPIPGMPTEQSEYPGFTSLEKIHQIAVLEQIIDTDIRPYIELDEGGIRIVDFKETELIIAYEGACTSCYSAVGATLSSIQQILAAKVHPEITVVPDPSTLLID